MIAAQPLDESYFRWLYSQVADPEIADPSLTYWKLLRQLFTREFVWHIPNDENRAEDGKELRSEFIQVQNLSEVDDDWMNLGCSMLELLVSLARHLSFEADGEVHYWFWLMMQNLGIDRFSDNVRLLKKKIDQVLDRVIFRTYDRDGRGGLFPLRDPDKDQRQVELWYQLSAYVLKMV